MIEEKQLLSMKIIHYFVVKENYNPIVISGISNEVWLENKNNVYSMIRVVISNIRNQEQYDYDILKTTHIAKQIKRKTFDFSMKVLSIYIEDEFYKNINIENDNKYTSIFIKDENDFKSNPYILKEFKNISDRFIYKENGFDLISRITKEMGEKNLIEGEKREKIMKNKKPIVTYGLLMINIIVFILMYLIGNGSEDTNTLINFGANYVTLTKAGDYYRLITAAFLHIGIIHLVLNMYSLYIVGTQIEYFYGKIKYLIIYLASAFIGSLFTVVLSSTNVVAAGASGAIFGLLGSIVYFGYHYRGYIGNQVISQVIPVVILNLLIGFTTPGIDNFAHIGGLIGGYLISMTLGFDNENKSSRVHGTIITAILVLFLIYAGFIR